MPKSIDWGAFFAENPALSPPGYEQAAAASVAHAAEKRATQKAVDEQKRLRPPPKSKAKRSRRR